MPALTITRVVSDGINKYTDLETVTYGAQLQFDETIAPEASNFELTFSFTKTKLKAIMLYATAAMAIYTNAASSGSPQETINLVANQMYLWNLDNGSPYFANPFGGNVTALYVTSTAGGVLSIRGLYDPAT